MSNELYINLFIVQILFLQTSFNFILNPVNANFDSILFHQILILVMQTLLQFLCNQFEILQSLIPFNSFSTYSWSYSGKLDLSLDSVASLMAAADLFLIDWVVQQVLFSHLPQFLVCFIIFYNYTIFPFPNRLGCPTGFSFLIGQFFGPFTIISNCLLLSISIEAAFLSCRKNNLFLCSVLPFWWQDYT